MKRMRILSVKSIPRFIGEYFNKKLIDIETINEFSKLLTTTKFDQLKYNKYSSKAEYIGVLNYTPELIKFYKDKSTLDHYYRCKYEDELDIPKSVANETYGIQIDDGRILYVTLLYNFDHNILILNVE